MNPNTFLLNLLSPGLPALLDIFRQALSGQQLGATSANQGVPQQSGPIASPFGDFGGGQGLPLGGYQSGPVGYPAIPAYPAYPTYPAYPVQPPAPQQSTAINFRPVIVQNQTNVLPLRSSGGINATMNAGTSLNVNGASIYR